MIRYSCTSLILWIHTSMCSFCCFFLQAIRVLCFQLLVLQDVPAVLPLCDGFFLLFPFLVVSHLIFIRKGLSLCIFPFPCLLLFPSSYFLSLYLLLRVKDCISNNKVYLEKQKISGEEILLFWIVFIGCINRFFGINMLITAEVFKVADFTNQMS